MRTQTGKLHQREKSGEFPAQFAVLIETGFPRENRNTLCIKTRSFTNVNYCNARIINYKDGLFVTANSSIVQKL